MTALNRERILQEGTAVLLPCLDYRDFPDPLLVVASACHLDALRKALEAEYPGAAMPAPVVAAWQAVAVALRELADGALRLVYVGEWPTVPPGVTPLPLGPEHTVHRGWG